MFANRHLFLEKSLKPKEKEPNQPERRQPVSNADTPMLQTQENGRTTMRPVRTRLTEVEIQWLG